MVDRSVPESESRVRIAVCIPVLNRGDLARVSISSLRKQLAGITAEIYLYDNGSAAQTRSMLDRISMPPPHRLVHVKLPANRGLPCVFNLFCRMIEEPCDFESYAPPDLVMISDADSYYKRPVLDMVEVLNSDPSIGVVSGHDSVEHPALSVFSVSTQNCVIQVREKAIERGQCLLMRREDLTACYPLPHHTNLDLDWELMQRHPRSMSNRGRRIVAVDATVHLGLYDSTWSPRGVPASAAEIEEIDSTLVSCGLMNGQRLARRSDYLEKNEAPAPVPPPVQESKQSIAWAPERRPQPAFPSPRPHQLIVLGMHRSGTSVVSGVLARLGLYVGESDQVLASDEANPTGYWERRDVLAINQRLMARRFADAYQVGHLPLGSFGEAEEPDLASAAQAAVAELDSHGGWLMKDPRICLTLPFWRPFLWAAACLIVTRHPLEIAQSLSKRDGLPLPYGISLWERYCVEALRNSIDMPRVIVSYHDLIQRPVETLFRLSEDLSLLGFRLPSTNARAADRVLPSLHRQNAPPAMEAGLLTDQQLRLKSALEDGSALAFGAELDVSLIAREILASYPQPIDLGLVSDG